MEMVRVLAPSRSLRAIAAIDSPRRSQDRHRSKNRDHDETTDSTPMPLACL